MTSPDTLRASWNVPYVQKLRLNAADLLINGATRTPTPDELGMMVCLAADPLSGPKSVWNLPLKTAAARVLSQALYPEQLSWFLERAPLLQDLHPLLALHDLTSRDWTLVVAALADGKHLNRSVEGLDEALAALGDCAVSAAASALRRTEDRKERNEVFLTAYALAEPAKEVYAQLVSDRLAETPADPWRSWLVGLPAEEIISLADLASLA